ncbi:hypothetical protein PZ897_07285 [Hoeflea sp. YIM 152468]|uniref:hypothetical protein n=1 Tax=Hoeflea sp. YIM 152468 TaxID=3031759 RepID=UPI0023D98DC6|nr:hypothetical protein [Hoeflea sp. YIM 152468]MDF1607973.1 hypothetical protein [Hoeflea sp. YIM 152468]
MADFVAVIRKAVDNLPDNTPENRTKVYDKARAAIRRQLEAINPPPSDEVIARQLAKLDLAIDEVEIEHAEALPADADETDALMAELESMVEKSPVIAEPTPAEPEPAPKPAPKPAAVVVKPEPQAPADPVLYDEEPAAAHGQEADPVPAAPVAPAESRSTELLGDAHDQAFGLGEAAGRSEAASGSAAGKASKSGLIAGLVVLGIVAAIAYAGWSYKDTVVAMFSASPIDTPMETEQPAPVAETAEVTPEPEPEPEADPAPVETAMTGDAPVDPVSGGTEKFTQRLGPDGTETDPGPAPAPEGSDAEEGRSVAELTDAGPADETDAEAASAATDAAGTPGETAAPGAAPPADSQSGSQSGSLGVTQKMILYEERLGQQSLEVKPGTVVWDLVSEASDSGPDEQVIRGEINNPDKGFSALITIKRNTDPSLPASHLVEIVFAVPPDFDGGSIDQLQRIAMKQTEADQGNPLIAVPAKITQDFYMVALNDLEEARKTNTDLLRQRNWIDIPVVYANGRQALITLEKGASGTEVFNQALDAWARATPQP